MGIERNAQPILWNFDVLRGVAAASFYRFECLGNMKRTNCRFLPPPKNPEAPTT